MGHFPHFKKEPSMSHSLSVTVQPPAVSSIGSLTLAYTGKRIVLSVLRSASGYFIGTADHDGPSRESVEYSMIRPSTVAVPPWAGCSG
jgi:hypothetical protein